MITRIEESEFGAKLDVLDGAARESRSDALLDGIGGTLSLGPVSVRLQVDVVTPGVHVSIDLFGQRTGSAILDRLHPATEMDGHVGLAKASVSVSVDFDRGRVECSARACVWSGRWKCRRYSDIAFEW